MKTRKFNGKIFKLRQSSLSKTDARFIAKDIRKNGRSARIIKEKDPSFGKGYSYSIYINKMN